MAKIKTASTIVFKIKKHKKLRRHSKKRTNNKGGLNYQKSYSGQGR